MAQGRYLGLELVKCKFRAWKAGLGEEKLCWNESTGNRVTVQRKLLD